MTHREFVNKCTTTLIYSFIFCNIDEICKQLFITAQQ